MSFSYGFPHGISRTRLVRGCCSTELAWQRSVLLYAYTQHGPTLLLPSGQRHCPLSTAASETDTASSSKAEKSHRFGRAHAMQVIPHRTRPPWSSSSFPAERQSRSKPCWVCPLSHARLVTAGSGGRQEKGRFQHNREDRSTTPAGLQHGTWGILCSSALLPVSSALLCAQPFLFVFVGRAVSFHGTMAQGVVAATKRSPQRPDRKASTRIGIP